MTRVSGPPCHMPHTACHMPHATGHEHRAGRGRNTAVGSRVEPAGASYPVRKGCVDRVGAIDHFPATPGRHGAAQDREIRICMPQDRQGDSNRGLPRPRQETKVTESLDLVPSTFFPRCHQPRAQTVDENVAGHDTHPRARTGNWS